MKILFVGDIFGEAGREAVKRSVPKLRSSLGIDLAVGNCENIAGGMGVTSKLAEELFAASLDVLTSGNHIYHHKEIISYLERNPKIIRPANFFPKAPGRGSWIGEVYAGVKVAVVNLIGQVFMPGPYNSPFIQVDQELEKLKGEADVILVDMHAEASSEKMAMGRYLDGKVSAVLGTHTHVPTADETVFPNGTAYITDVGMTGPYDSIIGMRKEEVLQKYIMGVPQKYQPASGDARLCGVVLDIEENTGKARSIQRVQEKL